MSPFLCFTQYLTLSQEMLFWRSLEEANFRSNFVPTGTMMSAGRGRKHGHPRTTCPTSFWTLKCTAQTQRLALGDTQLVRTPSVLTLMMLLRAG